MCGCTLARICTRTCSLTEEFDEAAVAVRLVVLLFERALVELLEAEGAHEVLRVELLAHGRDAAARDGLLAAGAQRAAALVVVGLAVRLALVVEEAAVYEGSEALPADEALGVPQRIEGRDVVLEDGPGAAATFGGKHVKVVLSAERLSILLVETFWSKKGSALGTEEVLRVPSLVQSRHNFIQYGPITVVASGREEAVVVFLAVRLPLALKEVLGAYLLLTVGAHKVLRVPRSAHGSHHLSNYRLLAGATDALSHRLDSEPVEVGLQASQHVVQLVGWFGGSSGRSLPL